MLTASKLIRQGERIRRERERIRKNLLEKLGNLERISLDSNKRKVGGLKYVIIRTCADYSTYCISPSRPSKEEIKLKIAEFIPRNANAYGTGKAMYATKSYRHKYYETTSMFCPPEYCTRMERKVTIPVQFFRR